MPVFDLVAVAKFAIRAAVILGFLAFVVSTTYTVYSMITTLWNIFGSASSQLDSLLSSGGGSGSVVSCVYYMMDALGINVVLTSFFVSLFGVLLTYGGFVAHIVMLRFGLYTRKLLLEAIR